ncbi:hypothetical protein MPTK1_5g15620 [Marchantia polymorpha subsp. ruderalis]|uniref:Uncharacterized protein n=2 Tax=Marchantia polymorpha TaxID=3197 RepID=A0AAF6BIQ4_MARPO|nr:hypothetical protein MARPO_0071s0049 [Marchantia polymorpha]BBN11888.1 hypothetical protein Mp_5g15620 [Marchantia polymorpha subsp. ruderalis]|eukprot:PTQ35432.1 hypothetical protein MARPO_0071s0049 [Marchantia polymorpha]
MPSLTFTTTPTWPAAVDIRIETPQEFPFVTESITITITPRPSLKPNVCHHQQKRFVTRFPGSWLRAISILEARRDEFLRHIHESARRRVDLDPQRTSPTRRLVLAQWPTSKYGRHVAGSQCVQLFPMLTERPSICHVVFIQGNNFIDAGAPSAVDFIFAARAVENRHALPAAVPSLTSVDLRHEIAWLTANPLGVISFCILGESRPGSVRERDDLPNCHSVHTFCK